MAEFQFVGDVSDLSVEQKELIANAFKKQGFENDKIEVQPVGKAGDNYAVGVKRVTVEKNGKTFRIIAKVASKTDMMRASGNTTLIFQNEYIMYTDVLPKLTELEKAAKIPEEERFRYAACYGAYLEAPNEIILLEDLAVPGFKILDRFSSFTNETVLLVLKNFARLHSLSYVLKYKEPEIFETLYKKLHHKSALIANMPEFVNWFDNVQTLLHGDKYKKVVKNATSQMVPLSLKLAKLDMDSKFSVITQGDSWTNNIMFRLEDYSTVECCMIDYQTSCLSNPVADLNYMIFLCTDYATRTKHYHDWIDYYHSQLDNILDNYGIEANLVYPRDQLDADLRRFAQVSLGEVIFVAVIILRDAEGAAELQNAMKNASNSSFNEQTDRGKFLGSDPVTIKRLQTKIEGVVDSFIEFGYI